VDALFYSDLKVSRHERVQRNNHCGHLVWLTGLSAAGKSSIAIDLERKLFQRGCQVYLIDGDDIRCGLCSDLGFSRKDRRENNRRVGEVAKLWIDCGFICIVALISPYRVDRAMVRKTMPKGQFVEVFVNAPLSVCESRDPKGLYAKARRLKIKNFTGISAPYEPPLNPEIELPTDKLSISNAVDKVLKYLQPRISKLS